MENNNVNIAAVQASSLSASKNLSIPNYTCIRKDRSLKQGGGFLFSINKIQFTEVSLPQPNTNDNQ